MNASEWFRTASATFAGGAIAIALVAIPTYVWLPREFDDIRTKVDASLAESVLAKDAASASKVASETTLSGIEGLIVSIAKMDSKQVFNLPIEGGMPLPYLLTSKENTNKFNALFPPDVLEMIKASGKGADFKYSNFGGKDWVFLTRSKFNEFSSEEQKKIEDALGRYDTQFIVD
jgi:hypothetical protein